MAKKSVQDIVVERLIKKIQEEKKLPWQKPFQSACMNWYSKHEYTGINKILLAGGEYITPNQLKRYNEAKGTNFWFEKGTPWEIVVFYSKFDKKITDQEAHAIINDPSKSSRNIFPTDNGWVRRSWFLRYYRVYNITHIKDKQGNKLEPKIGNSIIEEHTPAEEIVDHYVNATGVRIEHGGGGAYYTHIGDLVNLPPKPYFASTEAFYRVLFHELIHSTGTKERLDRACFHQYHSGVKERSREELIAEVGGLLLASEAGFREDTEWAENSDSYIAGWCSWMKDNPGEVINGMSAAEKAKNFILTGGESATGGSERSIDNPNQTEDVDEVVDESKVKSNPTPKDNKHNIEGIKKPEQVIEFYNTVLSDFYRDVKSQEERKSLLDSIKAVELRQLYYTLTKEKLPTKTKKVEILNHIRRGVESLTRTV